MPIIIVKRCRRYQGLYFLGFFLNLLALRKR